VPKLQRHLLPRIKKILAVKEGPAGSVTPGDIDWTCVVFKSQRIYNHRTMRLRYTTYDLRREEDLIRPQSAKANIMVLNPEFPGESEDDWVHPFRYGRVLGLFHANIIYVGPGNHDFSPRRMDFLWVRWYRFKAHGNGFTVISFPDVSDPSSFGFLDPADVCRACHVIPKFSEGQTKDQVGESRLSRDHEDYLSYIVNQ
jgi:hypothetical protein